MTSRKRVLVFGNHGQLANAIRFVEDKRYDLTYAGRNECDLRDLEGISRFLADLKPSGIINTAAYTAVDLAESDPADSLLINGLSLKVVGEYCQRNNVPLVHVSSDYVLEGTKGAPYVETDGCYPCSLYGYSKLVGERLVENSGARYVTLRTAWLFSPYGRNFALTMMNLAATRDVVRVVDDQYGNPTSTDDLASACLAALYRLMDDPSYVGGLYNFAGSPSATWADLAEEVFACLREQGFARPVLERITTPEYPTAARRPPDSRMDTSKFERDFPRMIKPWRSALREAMLRATNGQQQAELESRL